LISFPDHKTFYYTAGAQYFTVPVGVRQIKVIASGAKGARGTMERAVMGWLGAFSWPAAEAARAAATIINPLEREAEAAERPVAPARGQFFAPGLRARLPLLWRRRGRHAG
jgi:hypothetical protein